MKVNIRAFASVSNLIIEKLWSRGYRTSDDVLQRLNSRDERLRLAEDLEVEEAVVEDLVCRADLARVKGIGNLYAVLLQRADIYCAQDLAVQKTEDLYSKMIELNREHRIARRVPKIEHVENWVSVARELEPVLPSQFRH